MRGSTVSTGGARAVGLLFLLPAVLVWIGYQVIPVVRTVVHLLWQTGDEGGELVGQTNFQQIPGEWFSSLLLALLLGLLLAAIGVGAGIGIGALVRRAQRGPARIALALLGVGLVTYAPTSLTIALMWQPTEEPPGVWRLLFVLLPLTVLIGAAAGALTRSARVLLVIGSVVALGGAGWAAQGEARTFTTDLGAQFIYRAAFAMFEPGPAAAASIVLGVLVAVLGLGAGLMLLAIRPRFDLTRGPDEQVDLGQPGHYGAGARAGYPTQVPGSGYALRGAPGAGSARSIVAVGAAGIALLVLVLLAVPWLQHLGDGVAEADPQEVARVTWSTVARRVVEVGVTGTITAAAGFGLGYLRPFGRHSLRALLIFSPWLFVGLVPLMTGLFFTLDGPRADAPFLGLTGQPLSVPLMFVLAYLADGLRTARDGGQRTSPGPVLGVVLLGVGALAISRTQGVVWDVVFRYQDTTSAMMYLNQIISAQFGATIPLQLLTPVPLLVLGAAVLGLAAALLPGARLLPAAELARRLPVYGVPARAPGAPPHAQYPQQPGQGQYPPPTPQAQWPGQHPHPDPTQQHWHGPQG